MVFPLGSSSLEDLTQNRSAARINEMHSIQLHILKALTLKGKARYRDIKPAGVEGNQFMYHLKNIMDAGYIKKDGIYYVLTAKGKRHADRLSLATLRGRLQPKIVTMIYCAQKNGEVLLTKRSKEPFFGMISLPYGKVHLKERLLDAATRELFEKTGLRADLRHRGDVYLTIYEGEDLITQTLCHVFLGKNPQGTTKEETEAGTCFWSRIEKIDSKDLLPGLKEILGLIKNSREKHFFDEYFLNVKNRN